MGLGSHFNVTTPTTYFYNEWTKYFNSFDETDFTPLQYCNSLEDNIRENFSEIYESSVSDSHKLFLINLPMYYIIGNYIFVHAGLTEKNIDMQLEFLDKKDFGFLDFPNIPEQLRNKNLKNVTNDSPYIVVSGHCKLPDQMDFIDEKRIVLHSGSCNGNKLHCALIPEGATKVDPLKIILFSVRTESSF